MARTSPVNTGYTIINGTTSGSNGTKVDTWIEYKVTSQSVANNTSTIRVILYSAATKSSNTKWESAENFGYVGYDNGNKQYLNTTYDFSNYRVNKFGDYTYTIAHNSDGTKTITLQGSWSTSHSSYISGGVVPASGVSSSVTLPQIARASSVSNFTGTLGSAGTITITRASSSFTHTLQYSFDNSNWTNIATSVGTSYSWTPNVSLISNFSNQKTKTGYIRCITYSGGTNVGSKTSTLTLSVPSTTLGSVSATIGKSVTLTATNPCASGLTYQFAYSNGSTWTNIGSAQTGKTISWSIPTSLIGNISNAKSKGFSIRVITKIGSVEVNTATATATLTIPLNTSQAITGTIGSAVSIPITKAHSNLTTTIAYSFGSSGTTTIVTTTTSTSYSWTPPTSLLTQIPNSTSGTGSITITTYNGSVSCGSNNYTLTLSAASSVVPTSSLSLAMVNNNSTVAGWGIYLQGYSQVQATLTGNGVSGSTVKNMSISGSGLSASSTPSTSSATLTQTSSVLQTSGHLTYTGAVTDSRNRSATTQTKSIDVVAYTPPSVTGISLARSNSSGTIDSTGTWLKVAFTLTYSTAGNHNTASVSLRYKATSDTDWEPTIVVQNGDNLNLDLNVAENFEAQLIVSDSLNTNESAIINIPSAERVLNVNMSGSGLAIGGFSEDPGELEIYYPTDFKGDELPTINGENFVKADYGYNLYGATKLPSTCDLNDILTAGIYYTNTADGYTISNLPPLTRSLGAFNLKVEKFMNVTTPSITNNWQGVIQTFYSHSQEVFHRVIYRGQNATSWNYGRWIPLNEDRGAFNTSSAYITNANNMTVAGSYWVGGAYVSNLPVGSGYYGVLSTENPASNLYIQTFALYNNGRTWRRVYTNSQWYSWQEYQYLLWDANDTTLLQGTSANIRAMGTTLAWYNTNYTGSAAPSDYGYLQSYASAGSDVHQVWMTQANGAMYHRGLNGSSTPSSVGWKKIYDDSMSYGRSSVGSLDWGSNNDAPLLKSAIAYWNGAYSTNNNSNIQYVGTIKGGTWNGSAIGVGYGGTGATNSASARSNLGIGLTQLFSGDWKSGSANMTLTNGKNYKMIMICGQPNTNSSWTSVMVPTVLLSATATRFQISDNANYINFDITTSGNNVVMAYHGQSATGHIKRVYGVN